MNPVGRIAEELVELAGLGPSRLRRVARSVLVVVALTMPTAYSQAVVGFAEVRGVKANQQLVQPLLHLFLDAATPASAPVRP